MLFVCSCRKSKESVIVLENATSTSQEIYKENIETENNTTEENNGYISNSNTTTEEMFRLNEIIVELCGTNINQLSKTSVNFMLINLFSDNKILYSLKSTKVYNLVRFGEIIRANVNRQGTYLLKTINGEGSAELNFALINGGAEVNISEYKTAKVQKEATRATLTFIAKINESAYIKVTYVLTQVE